MFNIKQFATKDPNDHYIARTAKNITNKFKQLIYKQLK